MDGDQNNDSMLNLTPHDVVVFINDDMMTVTYPCGKESARVCTKTQNFVSALRNGVKVYSAPAFEDTLTGFPFSDNQKQVHHPNLIVSMVVGNHIPSWYRGNVYVPDTGPGSAIRENGQIVGVKRLYIVHKGTTTTGK